MTADGDSLAEPDPLPDRYAEKGSGQLTIPLVLQAQSRVGVLMGDWLSKTNGLPHQLKGLQTLSPRSDQVKGLAPRD